MPEILLPVPQRWTFIHTYLTIFVKSTVVVQQLSHVRSLQPHELQHIRLPCPSLSAGVCSNSYPLSQWCHPNISSSVTPFSSCPQSFPASGSFPMSRLCVRWPEYWSFSFSISPSNEYSGLISLGLTDLTSWLSVQVTLKSLLQHHSSQASVLQCSAFFMVQLSHWYMTTGKTKALTIRCQPVFVYKSVFHIYETPEGRS